MYCHTLVSPGTGATLQTFFVRSVLITLLLPTLGYPTKPTEMACLSLARGREGEGKGKGREGGVSVYETAGVSARVPCSHIALAIATRNTKEKKRKEKKERKGKERKGRKGKEREGLTYAALQSASREK